MRGQLTLGGVVGLDVCESCLSGYGGGGVRGDMQQGGTIPYGIGQDRME